jgi:hypothetical protein
VTAPEPEAAHTLLPFLERVANAWLRARSAARQAARGKPATFEPRRIELRPGGAQVEFSVNAMGGLIKAAPKVRLEITSTSPERTELRWEWGEGGGMSRAAGRGLSLIPQEKIDEWIRERAGDGVRVQGEHIVLEHSALMARFFAGPGPDSSDA